MAAVESINHHSNPWRDFISFIKRAGAIAVVGSVITVGSVGGLFIRQQFSTPGTTIPVTGGSATVFFGQNSSGSGDGSSCANQKAVSFFNTSTNWGTGKPIAPGITVGLCGTVTTTLTAQGSGTSGNPIILQFQAGSKVEQAVCNPCINFDNRSFLILDGNNTGTVDSSANGTNLANHSSSTGVSFDPCTNCEVKNLTVGPIYQIAAGDTFLCASGCTVDNAGARCIKLSGANNTIDGNTLHDASWCIYEVASGSDGNEKIYNNNIYNIDHGWAITGGGPFGHLYFHNNHMHDMALWDACAAGGNNCHHDGIHCFFGPGAGVTFADSYIYDNLFDGTLGGSATAWIYLESNASSPCANSTSKWYIFNNYFTSSDQVSTNPYVTVALSTVPNTAYMYNNTFAGGGSGHYGANSAACSDVSVDFENNAVGGCAQFNGSGSGITNHNAYAFQSGATNCWPASGGTCTFSTWQAAGHDTNSVFNSAGAVGSNVTGVGANLTSLCVGDLVPLCSTRLGVARATSGAWNAGSDN